MGYCNQEYAEEMKAARVYLVAAAVMAAASLSLFAWDYLPVDVAADDPEWKWRDTLAKVLGGQREASVEGGRVDVLTEQWAIELDWPHKWHEGIGQVLHYAMLTDRKPVLALMSHARSPETMHRKTLQRLELVEKTCRAYGIRLLVLLPQRPPHRSSSTGKRGGAQFWLNTRTGVRHRPGCRYYRNTEEGRPCTADEGRPCALCSP
ncbi:MAG: hypothetical protein DRP22_04955 [Verrucomicrobia bacterium]|nr:MAG: hypothetical protein DRP22_04955 [Verrucomicrobiota bacterium]